MFSTSFISANAGRVAAPVSGKLGDWCGTPTPALPTHPVAPHPVAEARRHMQDGMAAFAAASAALAPVAPAHRSVDDPSGIDLTAAAANGQRGIAAVDAALGYGHLVGADVRTALQSAAREARTAQHALLAGTGTPDAFRPLAARFDAAANWLHIADRLVSLQVG